MNGKNLVDIFKLRGRGVVALVGAGGKTTMMFRLAKELEQSGKKVLTTTTTKIYMPSAEQSPYTITAGSVDRIIEQSRAKLKTLNHFSAGRELLVHSNKLLGLELKWIDQLQRSRIFDWIIVEADGAAEKPLKASKPHEPVVPGDAGYLIVLAGLDALGRKLDHETVHRADVFSKNTGLPMGEAIDEFSLARCLAIEVERLKQLNSSTLKFVFLNKADHGDAEKKGAKTAELLMENSLFNRVVVGSLQAEIPIKQFYDMKG